MKIWTFDEREDGLGPEELVAISVFGKMLLRGKASTVVGEESCAVLKKV